MKRIIALFVISAIIVSTSAQLNFPLRDNRVRNSVEMGLALREFLQDDCKWDSIINSRRKSGVAFKLSLNVAGEVMSASLPVPVKGFMKNFDIEGFYKHLSSRKHIFTNLTVPPAENEHTIRESLMLYYCPNHTIYIDFPGVLNSYINQRDESMTGKDRVKEIERILDASPFSESYISNGSNVDMELAEILSSASDYYNSLLIYQALVNIFGDYMLNYWYSPKAYRIVEIPLIEIVTDSAGVPLQLRNLRLTESMSENTRIISEKMMCYFKNHNVRFKSQPTGKNTIHLTFPGILMNLWKESGSVKSFPAFCDTLCSIIYSIENEQF